MQREGDEVMTAFEGGTRLRLKVQPRARRDEVGPVEAGALRVRVTAPPVDAAANEAVCRLLAEHLGCRRGDIRLVRGSTSRQKVVEVWGWAPSEVRARLGCA
jgi:uncharacterized protein (TIGR00251 family)